MRASSATRSRRWSSRCCFRSCWAWRWGVIILRRRGLYFSLLTLAFSQIAFEIAYQVDRPHRRRERAAGRAAPLAEQLRGVPCLHAGHRRRRAVAAVAASRTRRSAACCRRCATTSSACRASATTPSCIKLQAFVIMGAVLGYAGGLLALMLRGAYADNLSWQHAGDALLMTVLGGVHQFLGPLWGAIAFILLEDRLSAVTENWWLMFAPIMIMFALASPEGMQGLVQRLFRRRNDWTLVRRGIPPRPASSRPIGRRRSPLDPRQADPGRARPEQALRLAGHGAATSISRCYPYQLHSLIGPNGAGQDHVLQHADRHAARPMPGEIVLRRPRHHPAAGASAHPAWHQPFVPDPQRVPQPDGVRERPRRRAGAQRRAGRRCGATPTRSTRSTPAPGRCWPRSGCWIARRSTAPTWRTASSVCWRSPLRSRPTPSCCCWTSRWPGLPRRIASRRRA